MSISASQTAITFQGQGSSQGKGAVVQGAVVLGIVAGNGVLPRIIAAKIAAREAHDGSVATSAVAVCHRGETQPELVDEVRAASWIKVGQLGKIIKFFRAHNVTQVVFAGGLGRPNLLRGFWPDFTALAVIRRAGSLQDDKLLRETAREFERNGMTVLAPQTVLPELLTPQGFAVGELSEQQRSDAHLGWEAACLLGKLDVGQTAIAHRGMIIALEGIEGTDACIRRAAQLCGPGFTVVKRAKPQQDTRLDLPTIGPETVRTLVEARAGALVIHVGASLLLNPLEVERTARAAALTIRAVTSERDLSVARSEAI